MVKNLPALQETQVCSLGQEGPPVKGMATHSSVLAWRIHKSDHVISWLKDPWPLSNKLPIKTSNPYPAHQAVRGLPLVSGSPFPATHDTFRLWDLCPLRFLCLKCPSAGLALSCPLSLCFWVVSSERSSPSPHANEFLIPLLGYLPSPYSLAFL